LTTKTEIVLVTINDYETNSTIIHKFEDSIISMIFDQNNILVRTEHSHSKIFGFQVEQNLKWRKYEI